MCYRLDFDLKIFTGTAFRQKIFYRNGVPDRSGLLSPLFTSFTLGVVIKFLLISSVVQPCRPFIAYIVVMGLQSACFNRSYKTPIRTETLQRTTKDLKLMYYRDRRSHKKLTTDPLRLQRLGLRIRPGILFVDKF